MAQDTAERTPQEQELLLALHGGVRGRLARSFCVLQSGVDTLHSYLVQSASPAVQGTALPLLDDMAEQLSQLERLTDNLADIALGTVLHTPQTMVMTELSGYLTDLCRSANEELAALGYAARVRVEAEGKCFLNTNEGLLNTMLANLFSNSVRARADTVITLRCTPQRQLVYLDTGPGLPQQAWGLLLGHPETALPMSAGSTGLLTIAACAADLGCTLSPAAVQSGFALEIGFAPCDAPLDAALHSSGETDAYRSQRQVLCLRREFAATLPCRAAPPAEGRQP